MGDYIPTERYYMRRNDIESLISMDTLDARLRRLPADSLSDEDRRAVEGKPFKRRWSDEGLGNPTTIYLREIEIPSSVA
jgi:hypothetical protein